MQNENKVIFQRERDFSGLLNATFAFLKQEFKPLMGNLLKRIVPLIILIGLSSGYYTYSSFKSFSFDDPFSQMFNIYYVINIVFSIATIIFMQLIVQNYIKHYVEEHEQSVNEYLKENLTKKFFPVLGVSILMYLSVFLGIIVFVIPGIWLAISLSLATTVKILEDDDRPALRRSMDLIKNYWWQTFGALFVIGIIYQIIATIFTLPTMITQFSSIFTPDFSGINTDRSLALDLLTMTIGAFAYLTSTIVYVFLAVHYYNLRERKESTGLMDKISELENE